MFCDVLEVRTECGHRRERVNIKLEVLSIIYINTLYLPFSFHYFHYTINHKVLDYRRMFLYKESIHVVSQGSSTLQSQIKEIYRLKFNNRISAVKQ